MRALNGLLLLAIALSVLPSSAGALELGPCEPAEAVKIIDTSLGQGKTLQQAMQMICLLYTSPSPRDLSTSRMPSSA